MKFYRLMEEGTDIYSPLVLSDFIQVRESEDGDGFIAFSPLLSYLELNTSAWGKNKEEAIWEFTNVLEATLQNELEDGNI